MMAIHFAIRGMPDHSTPLEGAAALRLKNGLQGGLNEKPAYVEQCSGCKSNHWTGVRNLTRDLRSPQKYAGVGIDCLRYLHMHALSSARVKAVVVGCTTLSSHLVTASAIMSSKRPPPPQATRKWCSLCNHTKQSRHNEIFRDTSDRLLLFTEGQRCQSLPPIS